MKADIRISFGSTVKSVIIAVVLILMHYQPVQAQYDRVLYLPVRVYLYSFEADPELNSTLDDAQVRTLFKDVNSVWQQAGIQWNVESIVRKKISGWEFPEFEKSEDRISFRQKLLRISPKEIDEQLWKVCIVRKFPIPGGGIYLPLTKTVFYSELNRKNERYATILAHELGHTLGLRHVEYSDNLMQSAGGDPAKAVMLTAEQIQHARYQAAIGRPIGVGQRPEE